MAIGNLETGTCSGLVQSPAAGFAAAKRKLAQPTTIMVQVI
jgi:hypothetical protein